MQVDYFTVRMNNIKIRYNTFLICRLHCGIFTNMDCSVKINNTSGITRKVFCIKHIFNAGPDINPLNTKRRLLYLKTQFVPRSKHFSSLL